MHFSGSLLPTHLSCQRTLHTWWNWKAWFRLRRQTRFRWSWIWRTRFWWSWIWRTRIWWSWIWRTRFRSSKDWRTRFRSSKGWRTRFRSSKGWRTRFRSSKGWRTRIWWSTTGRRPLRRPAFGRRCWSWPVWWWTWSIFLSVSIWFCWKWSKLLR